MRTASKNGRCWRKLVLKKSRKTLLEGGVHLPYPNPNSLLLLRIKLSKTALPSIDPINIRLLNQGSICILNHHYSVNERNQFSISELISPLTTGTLDRLSL